MMKGQIFLFSTGRGWRRVFPRWVSCSSHPPSSPGIPATTSCITPRLLRGACPSGQARRRWLSPAAGGVEFLAGLSDLGASSPTRPLVQHHNPCSEQLAGDQAGFCRPGGPRATRPLRADGCGTPLSGARLSCRSGFMDFLSWRPLQHVLCASYADILLHRARNQPSPVMGFQFDLHGSRVALKRIGLRGAFTCGVVSGDDARP